MIRPDSNYHRSGRQRIEAGPTLAEPHRNNCYSARWSWKAPPASVLHRHQGVVCPAKHEERRLMRPDVVDGRRLLPPSQILGDAGLEHSLFEERCHVSATGPVCVDKSYTP